MRIVDVTNRFVKRENRSGCYMKSEYDRETATQRLVYRNDGNLIAEIYDYKDPKNFRLRIHPKPRYCGRTEHINRVSAVLRSVQMQDHTDWDFYRYSAFISYSLKIHDRKLSAEYRIENHPLEFSFVDGRLFLDYQVLESHAFPEETPVTTPVSLESNSSLQSVSTRLTTILQGV